MTSNKSLIVLAPNGRRQTVKVTPNHTILQVLEEVCRKQGYKAQEYELRHHNHILDTQTILRFSGLPNNAMLEMFEAVKIREESDVVLGIQLEDGTRLLGTFSPSVNLFTILDNLCPQHGDPNMNPVVIYMRREVFGEEPLKNTTLRALGLTGGRAMLRLIHRTPEELKHQANVSAPLPSKTVVEKLETNRSTLKTSNASGVVTNALVTALKSERETKLQSPRPSILNVTPNDCDKRPNVSLSKRDLAEPDCSKSDQPNSSMKQQKLEVTGVAPLPNNILEDDIKFLGERNAVAYSLSNCNVVTAMYNDLPDDFFDLTVSDVKKLLSDLKQKRAELEEAPLQTRELRKLEESKKVLSQLGLYKRCVLRIQFPDRIILQGTFLPSESIQNVMEFIRKYLQHPDTNFHLFITPPKTILNPEETLVEIGCVPSALLHFGIQGISTVAINNTPSHMRAPFLNSAVMNSLSTPTAAILAATKSRTLITAYFGLCHSLISYGILVWGHSSAAKIIFSLQRRAVRILGGIGYRDDCKSVFRQLNILTLPSLFILESLLYVKKYKYITSTAINSQRPTTRNINNLNCPNLRLSKFMNGPTFLGIKYFNKLPCSIRILEYNQFKHKIKTFLTDMAFFHTDDFLNIVKYIVKLP